MREREKERERERERERKRGRGANLSRTVLGGRGIGVPHTHFVVVRPAHQKPAQREKKEFI